MPHSFFGLYTLTPSNLSTAQLCPPAQIGPPLHSGRISSEFRLRSVTAVSHSPCWNRSTSSLPTECVRVLAAMDQKPIMWPWSILCFTNPGLRSLSSSRSSSEHVKSFLAVGNVTLLNWLQCDAWGMSVILMPARLNGVYSSFRPKLRMTETGKSSPSAHAPFSAEVNVSLGGFVGVEKNTRCLWNAV